jgi:hypothetical protein
MTLSLAGWRLLRNLTTPAKKHAGRGKRPPKSPPRARPAAPFGRGGEALRAMMVLSFFNPPAKAKAPTMPGLFNFVWQ